MAAIIAGCGGATGAALARRFAKEGLKVYGARRRPPAGSAASAVDFRDEADNLNQFRSHFGGAFWSALVSFPQPIEGLVSHDVLVETFEEGESVASFLVQKGARKPGVWKVVDDPSSAYGTRWKMDMEGVEGENGEADLRCDVAVVIASFPHQGCRSCALRVHEVQVPGKSVSTSGLSFSYQARAV